MLTILGSLIGFGSSALPSVMQFFTDKRDQKHELAMMDKQMDSQRLAGEQKVQEVTVDAEIRSYEAAHKSEAVPSGVRWIDGLRASVRPVITYLFMALFISVKIAQIIISLNSGMTLAETAIIIWDEETAAIFATILTFWFGGRMFGKKNA